MREVIPEILLPSCCSGVKDSILFGVGGQGYQIKIIIVRAGTKVSVLMRGLVPI